MGSNIEVMTKVTLSEADKVELKKTYLDSGASMDLPELLQMLSEGGELQKSYRQLERKLKDFIKEKAASSEPQNRYDAFLRQLKNKKTIASYTHERNVGQFGKNVYHITSKENSCSAKLMYSRRNAPLRKFDVDYNFELTKTGGDRAKRNSLDFLMILEGSEGQDNRYVKLTASLMKSKVLKSALFNKHSKSWQFSISENSQGLFMRCFNGSGDGQQFPISEFENSSF